MRRFSQQRIVMLSILPALTMAMLAAGAAQAFGSAWFASERPAVAPGFLLVAGEAPARRGLDLMRAGDYRGALEQFDAVLKANPQDAEALFQRGNAHFHLENRAAAIADYTRALEIAPDRYEALVARAHVLAKQGDAKGAAEDIDRARAIESASEEASEKR
jgi:tetratricopeptide (TPR) repeat protein